MRLSEPTRKAERQDKVHQRRLLLIVSSILTLSNSLFPGSDIVLEHLVYLPCLNKLYVFLPSWFIEIDRRALP